MLVSAHVGVWERASGVLLCNMCRVIAGGWSRGPEVVFPFSSRLTVRYRNRCAARTLLVHFASLPVVLGDEIRSLQQTRPDKMHVHTTGGPSPPPSLTYSALETARMHARLSWPLSQTYIHDIPTYIYMHYCATLSARDCGYYVHTLRSDMPARKDFEEIGRGV